MASAVTDPPPPTSRLSPVLDRYRPVALAAVAVLLVVTVLPGAEQGDEAVAASVPTLPVQAASGLGGTGSTTASDAAEAGAGSTGERSPAPAAPSLSSPPSFPSSAPPASLSPPARTSGADEAPLSRSFAPEPAPTGTAPVVAAPEPAAEEPLRPTVTAWATATAGTPVAALGVPDGSLPVGTRVGQQDKASYLRLSGSATTLVLGEDEAGARGDATDVQACQVVDAGWEGGEAKSFDEAPEHDAARCVSGSRSDDGTWRFDLGPLDDPTDERGIALLPGPDAPADFQVAFRATA